MQFKSKTEAAIHLSALQKHFSSSEEAFVRGRRSFPRNYADAVLVSQKNREKHSLYLGSECTQERVSGQERGSFGH